MYSEHHFPESWFHKEPLLPKQWGGHVSMLTGFTHEKQVNLEYWADDDSRRNRVARILLDAAHPERRQQVMDALKAAYPGWPFED